mgnify:CR=1 FL=1
MAVWQSEVVVSNLKGWVPGSCVLRGGARAVPLASGLSIGATGARGQLLGATDQVCSPGGWGCAFGLMSDMSVEFSIWGCSGRLVCT